MARRGIGRFGGGKKLDRGRATHGAKWCFVTAMDEMINYAQHRAAFLPTMGGAGENPKAWTKHLQHQRETNGWELFKSQKEAKRWIALRTDLSHQKIRNLRRQVKMPLDVRRSDGLNTTIGHYVADFTYDERRLAIGHEIVMSDAVLWSPVVEEVKGFAEQMWLWKKKHFEAQYGVRIRQT